MVFSIPTVLLVVFIATVSYFDIRHRKIYNWLTLPFLMLGFVINTWDNGATGLYTSVLGMLTGLIILLLPFMLGWIGGGDVKFLAAVGAFGGTKFILWSALYGLGLFGMGAVIYLVARGRLKLFFSQLANLIFTWKYSKGLNTIEVSGRLPLGFFLGIGILFNWFYGNYNF